MAVPAMIAAAYGAYNMARFHHPFEFGHSYLPEMLKAPYGQFSWRYMLIAGDNSKFSNVGSVLRWPVDATWKHIDLKIMTVSVIERVNSWGLYFPIFNGFFYPLANPIFISLYASLIGLIRREKTNENPVRRFSSALLFTVLGLTFAHMVPLLMHTTNGGWHFGVRYFCDMIPFMLILLFTRRRSQWVWGDAAIASGALALQVYGTMGWMSNWW